MRNKIIAGNWKMNKTPSETKTFIEEIKEKVGNSADTVVFCVPAICIPAAVEAAKGSNIKIGAQNMYYKESGAYTGELAPNMLIDAGVTYVIIGHSERREYFGETDETVNLKTIFALENGLLPIVCVGESLTQREQGITIDLVRMQIKIAFKGISADNAKKVVIAYEPIWAIGTGKTATPQEAEEVCAAIRACILELYGKEVADEILIQYGGSVNNANAKELFEMGNIDGGLVGGASLKPEFEGIVNYK